MRQERTDERTPMTSHNPAAAVDAARGGRAPEPAPFTGLLAELRDLDYEQARSDQRDTTVYAAAGMPLVVEFDNTTTPPTAHLATADGRTPPWRVSFTADTPDRVQLMVLHAALGADADPPAALDAISTALRIPPDATLPGHAGS
jgi:hypothetical protein